MEEKQSTPGQVPSMPEVPQQTTRPDNSPYPYMAGARGEANRPERMANVEQLSSPVGPSQGMPVFQSAQQTQSPVVSPVATAPAGVVSQDDDTAQNPATAGDLDVIEKEWVERAKAIVEKTRTDPYLQEQKVAQMQSDYLRKRYGKELKVEA